MSYPSKTSRNEQIVYLIDVKRMPYDRIALKFGISKQRVGQIYNSELMNYKNRLAANHNHVGDGVELFKRWLWAEGYDDMIVGRTIFRLIDHNITTSKDLLSYINSNGVEAIRRWKGVGNKTFECIEYLIVKSMKFEERN